MQPRAHHDAHLGIERCARRVAMRCAVAGIVVGNHQHLGALDAGQHQRALARRVAAHHGQAGRLGFERSARAQRGDDERNARAVEHAHETARRFAVSRDDHVVLRRRGDVLRHAVRLERHFVGDRRAPSGSRSAPRSDAPSDVRNGVSTISTTVAAMNACDPSPAEPAGVRPSVAAGALEHERELADLREHQTRPRARPGRDSRARSTLADRGRDLDDQHDRDRAEHERQVRRPGSRGRAACPPRRRTSR